MSFITRQLKQTATYWSGPATFSEYGDPVLGTPVEIAVRWEDKTEQFIDTKGDEQHSRAVVWTQTVLATGGYLYLGSSVTVNPESVSGADQIRRVEKTPSVDNRDYIYKAYL